MSAPDRPAAVLWDMDGTIIDTEPYWMGEETAMVERAGGTWSHEQALELVGSDLRQTARVLQAKTPVTGSVEEIVDALLSRVIDSVRQEMPWRAGAAELISECAQAGVPMALVTMSWQPLAKILLESLPADTFRVVVTGDQVAKGKPHPEPYLSAARQLGVSPADCVAIEDSPTGVASALAAGVQTLAVSHMVAVEDAPQAHHLDTLEGMTLAGLAALFTG
ncbi:MAG: HAD family phosphatase [Ornithinimicrobium sp.]